MLLDLLQKHCCINSGALRPKSLGGIASLVKYNLGLLIITIVTADRLYIIRSHTQLSYPRSSPHRAHSRPQNIIRYRYVSCTCQIRLLQLTLLKLTEQQNRYLFSSCKTPFALAETITPKLKISPRYSNFCTG